LPSRRPVQAPRGFLNLSGYAEDSLSGQQAGVLAAIYYRRFKPMPLLSWYIGGSLEYGGVWEDKSDFGKDGIAAGSIFLGADTPLGPIYLGLGKAEGGGAMRPSFTWGGHCSSSIFL
jgi:NTE family protein